MTVSRSGARALLFAFACAASVRVAGAETLSPLALTDVQPGDTLLVDLPGAAALPVDVLWRRDLGPGRFTLCGEPGNGPGRFVAAVHGDAISCVVQGDDLHWIHGGGDGPPVVEAVDAAALPPCGGAATPPAPLAGDGDGGGVGDGECDDGSVVDIAVIWTPAARFGAGGEAGIRAVIDMMVADANLAYVNSIVDLELRLVYATEVDHDESGNLLNQLTAPGDGQLDEAHTIRAAYGADLIALVHSGGGGVAWGLGSLDPNTDANGFSSNGLLSAPVMVLAHEVGHNLGCCHAVGDGGGCGVGLLFPFSNGHRFPGDSGTLWRTVMAYNPGDRIPNFSNPDVFVDGLPTGVPEFAGGGADNARTILASKAHVANYRCATICNDLDLPPDAEDCNDNGIPDDCDLALGWATDLNGNGVSDDCECFNDTNGDGTVDERDCVNDACDGATDIGVGTIVFSTAQAGTDGPADNACSHDGSAQIFKDLWFRFSPATSSLVTASLCGSDFDTRLAVYAGSCPAVVNQAIACDDDSVCGEHASVTFSASAGASYYLRVGGYDGNGGEAMLTIETELAAGNDDCGSPSLLGGGATAFTTHGATTDGPSETGACGGPIENDVWFRYAAGDGGAVAISVCDADFDVMLAVYEQCPGTSGQALACSGDSIHCSGSGPRLVFTATAGLIYRVRVGGGDDESGAGTIVVETGLAACPSDVTGDGVTDAADLEAVIDRFGSLCAGCAEDVVFNGLVNVNDIVAVIEGWGACP